MANGKSSETQKNKKSNHIGKKSSENFDTDGLILVADAIIFCILLTTFLLDCFNGKFLNVIHMKIEALSIDSVLQLVSILSAFFVPSMNERMASRYHIDQDDYDILTGTSKKTYYNLIIVSLIMVAFDAIFYVFDFRLSLLGVLASSLVLLFFFVIPVLFRRLDIDKTVTKLSVKNFKEIYNTDNEEYANIKSGHFYPSISTNYHECRSRKEEAVCSIFESLLYYKSFETLYENLCKGLNVDSYKDNPDTAKVIQDNVCAYLIERIYQISLRIDDPNEKEFSSDELSQLISNLDSCRNYISNFKEQHSKLTHFRSVASSLNNFYTAKNLPKTNRIQLEQLLSNIIEDIHSISLDGETSFRHKKDYNDGSLIILMQLFDLAVTDGNYWIIDFLNKIDNTTPGYVGHNSEVIILIIFLFAFVRSIGENSLNMGTDNFNLLVSYLEKKTHHILEKAILNLDSDELVHLFYLTEVASYYSTLRVVDSFASSSSLRTRLDRFLFESCLYLLLYKTNSKEGFYDNFFYTACERVRDRVQHFFHRGEKDLPLINDFSNSLLNYLHIKKEYCLDLEEIKTASSFITYTPERYESYRNYLDKIEFDKLISKTNASLKHRKDYIDIDEHHKDNPKKINSRKIDVYIKTDEKEVSLYEYPSANKIIAMSLIRHYFDVDAENSNLINVITEYDDHIISDIVSFNPDYAFTTLLNNSNKKLKRELKDKLPNLGTRNYFSEIKRPDIDIYCKNDAIRFYIKIIPNSIETRQLSRHEAMHVLSDLLLKDGQKRMNIDEIIRSFFKVTFTIDYAFLNDTQKMLLYQIPDY